MSDAFQLVLMQELTNQRGDIRSEYIIRTTPV